MNSYPTLLSKSYLWFVITFLVIIISCSKDSELLKDAILTEPSTEIVNSTDRETEEEIEEEESEGEEEELIADETETVTEKEYETRTTVFSTVHDAHVQSGKGYNLDIIRLEEGNRESYLMFDLSPIDSIGGSLEEVHLEFTITNDDGHEPFWCSKEIPPTGPRIILRKPLLPIQIPSSVLPLKIFLSIIPRKLYLIKKK